MRATMFATALSLLLVGCGGERVEPANRTEMITPQETENRISALPEAQRNAVFIRAIRDAGEMCQHVARSERIGEHRGYPVWRAWCDEGSTWTIVLAHGASVQVVNDAEARLAGANLTAPEENVQ